MIVDSQLATPIVYGAGLLIIGLFGWVVTTLRRLTVEMASWRVALFGMQGDNGMAGDLKQLREDVDGLLGLERRQFTRRASDIP